MKKMLLLLLVAGIMMLGTFPVAEEISESPFEVNYDFSDDSFGDGIGDPSPDGEGPGGGGGDFPG